MEKMDVESLSWQGPLIEGTSRHKAHPKRKQACRKTSGLPVDGPI